VKKIKKITLDQINKNLSYVTNLYHKKSIEPLYNARIIAKKGETETDIISSADDNDRIKKNKKT